MDTLEKCRELFYYDETSPTFLRWKVDRWSGKHRNILTRAAGDVAGCLHSCVDGRPKRVEVKHDNKITGAHRIIWQLFNGVIAKGLIIDHKDSNPWNNKIENLALKNSRQNNQNKSKAKNNTSGVTGCAFVLCNSGRDYYARAIVVDNEGKIYTKKFRVDLYGDDGALDKARLWRASKLVEVNLLVQITQRDTVSNELSCVN